MQNVEPWPLLYQSEDPRRVRMVATCLAAMEFDVRLAGRDVEEDHADRGGDTPLMVRVRSEDLPHLLEVLDDLIDEQEQFDNFVGAWHHRVSRTDRRLLITLIIIVGALAAIGATEL